MLPLALLSPTGLSSYTADIEFDVDDSRILVALQYHFLVTCGQHVVRECSFCVTMTRASARYNVSKECFRPPVITS